MKPFYVVDGEIVEAVTHKEVPIYAFHVASFEIAKKFDVEVTEVFAILEDIFEIEPPNPLLFKAVSPAV